MTEQAKASESKQEPAKTQEAAKTVKDKQIEKLNDEALKAKEIQDFNDYQEFASLKFLQWDGEKYEKKKIKASALVVYEKFEKKFRDYKGKKPKKDATVHVSIEDGPLKLVGGYGVPDSLYKKFKSAKIEDKWF